VETGAPTSRAGSAELEAVLNKYSNKSHNVRQMNSFEKNMIFKT
jgi:hypothetical protein